MSPQNAEAWTHRAVIQLRRNALALAEASLLKAQQINPHHVRAAKLLCALYSDQKIQEPAEKNCRLVLRTQPSDPDALMNLAAALWMKGDPEESRRTLLALTLAHPDHVEGWSELAGLELARGRERQALGYLARALALNPRFEFAIKRKGFAHERLSEFAESVDAYQLCLEIEPDDPECKEGLRRALEGR